MITPVNKKMLIRGQILLLGLIFILWSSGLVLACRLDQPVRTNFFIFFWGTATLNGQDLQPGDQIRAYVDTVDLNGGCIGNSEVTTPGYYGVISVYGDDATTTTDKEGASSGDLIHFVLCHNGIEYTCNEQIEWNNSYINDSKQINLTASSNQPQVVINLYEGFNLIGYSSLPMTEHYFAFDLVNDLGMSNWRKISGLINGEWASSSRNGTMVSGTNFEILTGVGYIIYSKDNAQINLGQQQTQEPNLSLTDGYHLISISPENDNYSSYNLLTEVGENHKLKMIRRYKNKKGRWESTFRLFNRLAGEDFNLRKGEGYVASFSY